MGLKLVGIQLAESAVETPVYMDMQVRQHDEETWDATQKQSGRARRNPVQSLLYRSIL